MKTIKYILGVICISVAGSAWAQNLNSAYFMDGFSYGYELNPAKDYDRQGFVGLPLFMLGNTNISASGNLDYADIFHVLPNGKTATFMHPDLQASDVLKNFSGREKLNVDMRIDLVNFGFHAFNGYNFFNMSIRANAGVTAPYELFEMAKTLENKNYNIEKIGAQTTSWVEFGFGHSHQVTDAWRVGGTFKLLLGAGRADIRANNIRMELAGEDQWIMTSDAQIEASAKGLTWGAYNTEPYENGDPAPDRLIDFDKIDISKAGIGGVGIAFDLGTEWDLEKAKLVKGLKVSAALLDLGFISWNNTLKAENVSESYTFNGFQNVRVKDGQGRTMSSQFDDFKDGVQDLFRFQDKGNDNGARMLGATLNIGVQYKLPCYKKLEFGFLSTTRIQGAYSWNDNRLSPTYIR